MFAFTWGSDPEFMLVHKGQYKSAIGVLPPKEKAIEEDGYKFYYDNVLAEAQMVPARTKQEAVENVRRCLTTLADLVAPYQLVLQSAQNYPKPELKHKDARVAGCKPEWCVYQLIAILPPQDVIEKTAFRTAGGHVHLGGSGPLQDGFEILNVVRMMDLFLGVPAVLLDKDKTAKDRRRIYGHAGSHRVPPYGVEYRPLSNFWLASPKLVEMVYDLSGFILDFVAEGNYKKFWSVNEDLLDDDDPSAAYTCFGYDLKSLINCINSCDRKQAEKFMIFVNNYLPDRLVKNLESLIRAEPGNVYENWGLKA